MAYISLGYKLFFQVWPVHHWDSDKGASILNISENNKDLQAQPELFPLNKQDLNSQSMESQSQQQMKIQDINKLLSIQEIESKKSLNSSLQEQLDNQTNANSELKLQLQQLQIETDQAWIQANRMYNLQPGTQQETLPYELRQNTSLYAVDLNNKKGNNTTNQTGRKGVLFNEIGHKGGEKSEVPIFDTINSRASTIQENSLSAYRTNNEEFTITTMSLDSQPSKSPEDTLVQLCELWNDLSISLNERSKMYFVFQRKGVQYMEDELNRLRALQKDLNSINKLKGSAQRALYLQHLNKLIQMLGLEKNYLAQQITEYSQSQKELLYEKWDIQIDEPNRKQTLISRIWNPYYCRDIDGFEKSARLVLDLYGDNVNDLNYIKNVQSNSKTNNYSTQLREGVTSFLKALMVKTGRSTGLIGAFSGDQDQQNQQQSFTQSLRISQPLNLGQRDLRDFNKESNELEFSYQRTTYNMEFLLEKTSLGRRMSSLMEGIQEEA